jgi:cation diffusion facilitator CzcD-associated flavoprotein CzcO
MTARADFEVAIAGAGFSGLGMAIALEKEAKRSFVLFEKAADVGGTWRENVYPGCACDVPSHLYSFSFEPNPNWSRMFSPQPEIWDYLRHCARKYGIAPHMRFNAQVERLTWDDASALWRIRTSDGQSITARAFVSGMGGLHVPNLPDIEGASRFAGEAWHSAQWRNVDLVGRNVAIIGTGASAIQIAPEVAPQAERLTIYQRTPPWIAPKLDRPIAEWERKMFAFAPFTQELWRRFIYAMMEMRAPAFLNPRSGGLGERLARRLLAQQIADPVLRAKATPNYAFGCKRVLISNDYYPTLVRANVELVTEGVERIVPAGIRAGGVERAHDVIIYATGFKPFDILTSVEVRGQGGRSLNDEWAAGPQAYWGLTVNGYPNLFFLMGPNTGLGHNSMVYMIESQIAYVMDYLHKLDRSAATHLVLRREAQDAFNAEIDARLAKSVWNAGGCKSWYLSENGKNYTIWPGHTFAYRAKTRRVRIEDYVPAASPIAAE